MSDTLSLCAQEVRSNDHDQFLCGLFAPEKHQNSFYALHVFEMETARIRDLVNEPHLGLIRLQWWRDLVDGVYAGGNERVENGSHKEIVSLFSRKEIDKSILERYFNARSFDMEDRAHDDLGALLRYGEATAGAINQMKENVMDLPVSQAALEMGKAQALYRLLRSLAYQARSGRCKIPLALRNRHQLDMAAFSQMSMHEALKDCVNEIVHEIFNCLEQARLSQAQPNAVLLSSVSIEDYCKRLAKLSYDPFDPRIGGGRLSRQVKLAYRAWRGRY